MRIALVIEHFDALRGGAERFAVWLAGELARRGLHVDVLCHDARARYNPNRAAHQGASHDAGRSAAAKAPEYAPPPDGVTVHRLPGAKLSSGIGFRQFGRKVEQWCRRQQPDVVHSISVAYAGDLYHSEAGVYAGIQEAAVASRMTSSGAAFKRLLLSLPGKARTLLALERAATEPWNPHAHGSRANGKSQAGAGGAWRLVCISPMMEEEFQHYYGVAAERLVRLDNPRLEPLPDLAGVPALREAFRGHYKLGPQDRVAAFVGHDFRRKGLRWAIEAVAQSQTKWKLLVVGLGKVREYVELVEDRGLQDRVHFVGPTQEMDQVYAASDALIIPTFYDSFGFVAVEAMSYGLPVIATRKLGCYRLITDNQVGTIVNSPRDVAAMAAALDALPAAGPERSALARRAIAAAGGVSAEAFLERLLALYDACLVQKKEPYAV
ncbi:MAG: glycosyltransferase family 4 protein [Phycisphaerae bacterium]